MHETTAPPPPDKIPLDEIEHVSAIMKGKAIYLFNQNSTPILNRGKVN